MSEWRDIWKKSLFANSKLYFSEKLGQEQFENLLNEYGEDGMIYYAKAEAFELKGNKEKALENYEKAKKLFPVDHWKAVAEKSYSRVQNNKSAEEIYNQNNFFDYLWFVFQKVYEFVYLDDFVRYVCVSAVSRASSEWPLSLIDFRTVLELIVNNLLEQQERFDFEKIDLNSSINQLQYKGIINDANMIETMHWIRKNGNKATHDIEKFPQISDLSPGELKREIPKIKSFYKFLEYMNSYYMNLSKKTFSIAHK